MIDFTKEEKDMLLQIINQSNFRGDVLEAIVEIKRKLKESV